MSTVSTAAYNAEWYNVNLKLRRKLLTVLIASQKEYCFKVFAFGDINVATFTNLFQASLTMLTFFKEINAEN